jgi:hypothetical protein
LISISALKPELEIPIEVWDILKDNDFVNFSVPLLNPPEETGSVLFWGGRELLLVTENTAAFASDAEAAKYMPYGEMFKVIASPDGTKSAQIYSIFFEKERDEWFMMYRLMNCDRALAGAEAVSAGLGGELPSNWMLALSGVENWLTLDAYLNYYCKFESYNRGYIAANIREQLLYMEGPDYREDDARVMVQPGGIVVLVSKLAKGWALVVDIIKNARLARFIMDDPPHLIEMFWRLHSKIFLNARDRLEMEGMTADAGHFLHAIKAAKEQRSIEQYVTAAAFYL